MEIFQIPQVVPTRVLSLALVFLIGIFSFVGQVTHQPFLLIPDVNRCEDASSHGVSTRDSSQWFSRHVRLSMSSAFILFSRKCDSTVLDRIFCCARVHRF